MRSCINNVGVSNLNRVFVVNFNIGDIEKIEVTVGDDSVATTVLIVIGAEEVRQDFDACILAGIEDIINNVVALDVDIRIDLVSDLEGEQAQANCPVEGTRGKPLDPSTTGEDPSLRSAPKTHMVTLRRFPRDCLLISKMLFSPEEYQVRHGRRIIVLASEPRTDHTEHTSGTDGVGPHPTRGSHCCVNIDLATQ